MSSETEKSAFQPPGARLLIATGCAHCPAVLDGLSQLLKAGKIGRLEVINITVHPEAAESTGARTVPSFTLGPFSLSGLHSLRELEDWVERAATGTGMTSYYGHMLETNRLAEVVARIEQHPATLGDLLLLIEEPETPMAVRIGVGAVIEDLAGTGILVDSVDQLAAMTRSDNVQIRADACHYLGLTANPAAMDALEACLEDENEEVQEIAAESLALLRRDEEGHDWQ